MVAPRRRRLKAMLQMVVVLVAFATQPTAAQKSVSFLANQIIVSSDGNTIRANGDVKIDYDNSTLTTENIVYDRGTGTITFPDQVELIDKDGSSLVAQQGQISDSLVSGYFRDVELSLASQFKILAKELVRRDEDVSVLRTGTASSCRICENGSEPVWQIKATEVEHRRDEQRLYFTNAVFEFLGIPVFFAPRIKTPDPTVDRASGFLVPGFTTSDTLGFGVRIPYFWRIGTHSDITVTPFVSSEGAFLLEGEYRQLFDNGAIIANGAVALADPLSGKDFRSFATVSGHFDLQNDYDLDFVVNSSSDRTFRQEYNFGDEDRLENFVTLSKTTSASYFSASASITQSLREGEDTSEIPFVFPEVYYTRVDDIGHGWRLRSEFQSTTLLREDDRQTSRVGLRSTISNNLILKNGVAFDFDAKVDAAYYNVFASNVFDEGDYTYLVPTIALTSRYPLAKNHPNGARSLVEPIIQIIWSPDDPVNTPNEDSVQLEFEENNLFSISRYPGFDAIEVGSRVNVGVSYLYEHPDEWRLGVSLGQVFRFEDTTQFEDIVATGLNAQYSDTVLALTFDLSDTFSAIGRALIGRNFSISKYESQLAYNSKKWAISLDYTFLEENVILGGVERQDQIDLSFGYRADENWTLKTSFRHDFTEREPIEQFFGAEFKNECISLDFGLTLDYTTEGSNEAEQEFGVAIELLGFGGKSSGGGTPKSC